MSRRFGTVLFISGMFFFFFNALRHDSGYWISFDSGHAAARPHCWFSPHLKFARACKRELSNFKFNAWNRGATHNEQSTDEGHSPETSGHLRFWHFHQHSSLLINFKHSQEQSLEVLTVSNLKLPFILGIVQGQYLTLSCDLILVPWDTIFSGKLLFLTSLSSLRCT